MSNEQIIADHVKTIGGNWISIAWFLWALRYLESANRHGAKINPEYLRATRNPGYEFGSPFYSDEPRPITADK